MLKKISQENSKAEKSVYIYLHRPVSAEDLKAQFKWGRVKAQVRYKEGALASGVHRLLLL